MATETGVGPDYSLIGCVKSVCQQTMKSEYLGQILSLFKLFPISVGPHVLTGVAITKVINVGSSPQRAIVINIPC